MSNNKSLALNGVRVVHMTSAHSEVDVRIFYKECQALAQAGYDVTELTNTDGDTVLDKVHVRGLGTSRGRLHRMSTKLLKMAWEAFRLNADIYHFHDPELIPVALLLRAFGKCVIYDIHEDLPRDILTKEYIPKRLRVPLMHTIERLENAAARRMSGLVPATPAIADRFRSINPNMAVVGNFPMLSELAAPDEKVWTKRSKAVAYIGGMATGRGARELLEGIRLVRLPEARLELAGWYSDPRLQSELQQRPGWERVRWHGLLDRPDIARLLGSVRAGVVVLHPQENFLVSQPVKLFEYMAAGLPVIASDFPLWRKVIEHAGCGLMVDPLDPKQIAEAIEYLLTHDDEAEAMGRRGRKAVEQRFNWHTEERKLLALYESLSNAHRPRAAAFTSAN